MIGSSWMREQGLRVQGLRDPLLVEDKGKRQMFKDYMKVRKAEGYKTPKGEH